jgi:IS1 family transposase
MTGVAINTVVKMAVDAGEACADYLDRSMRNLPLEHVQVDECWAFCYCKAKNLTPEIAAKHPGAGDVWTWAAICADTKLIPSWIVGPRDTTTAQIFLLDLASRLDGRIQLTSDGLNFYVTAVARAFGAKVDFSQLQKIYGNTVEGQKRYSPAVCIGCEKKVVTGNPDPAHINTSFIERANLTLRMGNRRYTRLTNGFSKKIENHTHSVALFMMFYNFARQHKTLRCSPAQAAKVDGRLWEIKDIVEMIDAYQVKD